MNFKYFLNGKISKHLARGILLAWEMWFQMYDFEVEWIMGNSNFLADALTREMNKVHIHRDDIFHLPGKTPANDNFETFDQRFRLLEYLLEDMVVEIKKLVGLRLQRSQWIQRFQGWKHKNVGVFLNLD